MLKQRLVIDPDEILHLEIRCEDCKTSSILPLEDLPNGQHFASLACVTCQKPFSSTPEFQGAVTAIRNGLALYCRRAQSNFTICLVVKQ